LPDSPCRLTTPDGEPLDRAALGALGERIAAAWLHRHRCHVLFRNFRAPRGGEVDLVVRDGRVLAFTEVKTRRAGAPGRPLEAVTRSRTKRRLIRRGAMAWLDLLGTRDLPWRFDVVEVILAEGQPPQVHRVRDVFSDLHERLRLPPPDP